MGAVQRMVGRARVIWGMGKERDMQMLSNKGSRWREHKLKLR